MDSGNAYTINFFSAVVNFNISYLDYVAPYVASVLYHNADSTCELLVPDATDFNDRYASSLSILNRCYPDRFLIRDIPDYLKDIAPNSIRFLAVPLQKCELTYIGDVDILILDPGISDWHRAYMKKTGLPYSNNIRKGQSMLTGLQCVETGIYYSHLDEPYFRIFAESLRKKGLAYNHHDEKLLYSMVNHRIGHMPEDVYSFETRPVHGIHMSPNREPLGQPGWEITPLNTVRYLSFRESDLWKELKVTFSTAYLKELEKIDEAVAPVAELLKEKGKGI